MLYKEIKVRADHAVEAVLSLYIQESYPQTYGERKRPIVLICPGGGYGHLSVREAEPIALQFLTAGCHAAVLWYDMLQQGVEYPQELLELAWSAAYIREHADSYAVDADKLIVAGFSAGGHLAACLGCFWQKEWLEKKMRMEKERYRPNGLILAYPVITSGTFAHKDSFERLMGSRASASLAQELSLEGQVTDQVPPVFMWHTFEDETVPLENSLLFASALRRAGVSFEYHVFPHGGHGYALATKETSALGADQTDPQCCQWMALCKAWLAVHFTDREPCIGV